MKNNVLALCGAVAGGVVGYFAFFWVLEQGFYALALPGALLGAGAGLVRNRSVLVAVACGLLALALGVFAEYRFAFAKDESLAFFLSHHLSSLSAFTLVMIAVGGAIGFWIPVRRRVPDGLG